MKKPSELFEGKNSSLYEAWLETTGIDNCSKEEMIKWAESEIKEWKGFIKRLKKES